MSALFHSLEKEFLHASALWKFQAEYPANTSNHRSGAIITVPKQESLENPSQITQIQRDLRARLAPTARVNFRGSVGYQNATTRWSAGHHPDFAAVVVPTSTEDVAASVRSD
ncbi:MAG: hypothetical protein Q9185_002703 [Variospora sp. 1 TL-2023]